MLTFFFRHFFIILCSFFIYSKLTNHTDYSLKYILSITVLSFPITYSAIILFPNNPDFRIIYNITMTFAILYLYFKCELLYSLSVTLIAFVLSYLALFFSCSIISVIILFSGNLSHYTDSPLISFLIGLLQSAIIYLLLRYKRFINGISHITKNSKGTIAIIIAIACLFYIIIVSNNRNHTTDISRTLAITIFLILSISLIKYYRYRITQTYRENMNLVYEKSLETEIANLKEEIQALQTDNQHLTQIVHKDNKLVPAMESTILEFLQSANTLSADELSARGDELSNTLHEMAINRTGILTSLSPSRNGLPSSGFLSVDGLLSYMGNRANENKINYRFKIDDNIKDLISTAIHEEDLRHLLSDLIENAIIAVKNSEFSRHISIYFGNLQDKFLLEISDNGIPFSPDSYQTFGNEPCSTHQEEGGTGTGLMDIWKLKKKYKASLYIYEYESKTNIYTKKISFLFDGKNHFLLKTYRDKEVRNALIRGDLHVFPNNSSNV